MPDAHPNGHPDNTVVVLFGATGDLAARKLIPGFFRLHHAGLMPRKYRIIGTSPIAMDTEGFRAHAHDAVEQFGRNKPMGHSWDAFLDHLDYVVSDPPHLGDVATAVHAATSSPREPAHRSEPTDAVRPAADMPPRPPAGSPYARQRPTEGSGSPLEVTVRIGRVEVRPIAAAPPPRPPATEPRATTSLEDYLRARISGRVG